MAFLTEHVAILGYLCLASTLPYSPLFCWIFIELLQSLSLMMTVVSSLRSTSNLGFPVSSLGHSDQLMSLLILWTLSPFASCCIEQLMLTSAVWCNVGSVTSVWIILDLYSDTSYYYLLSCLELLLCYQLFQPLPRALCVYDMKCTDEG